MRFSTIASFLVAMILAVLAVYGAQNWLNLERAQITEALRNQTQAQDTDPKRTLVVANELIEFGERIDGLVLREIEWPSDVIPEGSFEKIGDVVIGEGEDEARYALTTIESGEPILTTKITDPGQIAKLSTALTPGMKAISIRVNDVLGVAGFVLPGDRVDVLLTRGGGGGTFVDVLLQGVKVLAIDQIADDRKDKPSVVRTVTFEVNTIEAQKLVLGGNVGTLSLALRNVTSTGFEDIERITLNDLNELDVAEDLIPTQVVETPDPSLERIANLEEMLKNLSEGVPQQIQGVEEKNGANEPIIVEKEVVIEKIVEAPKPVISTKRTVGVIRNGSRAEYKVEQGDVSAEGSEVANLEETENEAAASSE
ncbi:MAG: Flp pilus assembly protein CpaB [Boseongicola sp.]|nr:Flp pilus assembly protein CpaB [Boseongicola sp.]